MTDNEDVGVVIVDLRRRVADLERWVNILGELARSDAGECEPAGKPM